MYFLENVPFLYILHTVLASKVIISEWDHDILFSQISLFLLFSYSLLFFPRSIRGDRPCRRGWPNWKDGAYWRQRYNKETSRGLYSTCCFIPLLPHSSSLLFDNISVPHTNNVNKGFICIANCISATVIKWKVCIRMGTTYQQWPGKTHISKKESYH